MDWGKFLDMEWLLCAEHLYTLLTVLASALISWGISAWYFYRGNRNALRSNVIYPIKRILDDKYSGKNFVEISTLSKKYENRYLTKKELKTLDRLLAAYQDAYRDSYEYICAESLFSYFCYKLKKNDIDPLPVEINDEEGNVVALDYPPDIYNLRNTLIEIVKYNPPEWDEANCQKAVQDVFDFYCKNCYTQDSLTYFDDYKLSDVIHKSHVHSEWKEKQDEYELCKKEFLELKLVLK